MIKISCKPLFFSIVLSIAFSLFPNSGYALTRVSCAPKRVTSVNYKIEGARDYWAGPTKTEEKNIRWIITTLGKATWKTLVSEGLELRKRGDTLSNIHPYNFLLVIFRDEELKCHARAIKINGGLAKSSFYDGICTSLKKEDDISNLKPEYLTNFAKRIGMDVAPMRSFITQKQWEAFVDHLILNAPRETDPKRYNM